MLAVFILGLDRSHRNLAPPEGVGCLLRPATCRPLGLGKACLLASGAGLVVGGLTVMAVGMTCVFVPQDLSYMGLGVEELHALNPRLAPLIAHDRAGFGGAVCCCGLGVFLCVWCGTPSRGLWWTLALVGAAGFGAAIGVHPAVGYNDVVHLAPAVLGALLYLTGLVFTCRPMMEGHSTGDLAHPARPARRE